MIQEIEIDDIARVTQNKKITFFIPNYNRDMYINHTISSLTWTDSDCKDQCIIIGSEIPNKQLVEFKLTCPIYWFKSPKSNLHLPRNGGFLRNIVIKRCQSEWFLQKDPEIWLARLSSFDWISTIKNTTDDQVFYRPQYISMMSPENTLSTLNHIPTKEKIELVNPDKHFHLHHCLAVKTKYLQEIRGYDEDFIRYGPEDRDIWVRLKALGLKQEMLMVASLHLWHPRDPHQLDWCKLQEMENLFLSKDPNQFIRNQGREWGNG